MKFTKGQKAFLIRNRFPYGHQPKRDIWAMILDEHPVEIVREVRKGAYEVALNSTTNLIVAEEWLETKEQDVTLHISGRQRRLIKFALTFLISNLDDAADEVVERACGEQTGSWTLEKELQDLRDTI